jgi:transposase
MNTLTNTPKQTLDPISSQKLIDTLQEQVADLKEQLAWFQKQVFGQRSEKIIPSNPDAFFLPGFDLTQLPPAKKADVPAHTRKTYNKDNPKKLSFPDTLPIVRTILDLKDEDKFCSETGKPLIKIGEDVSQKLAHTPGSYYIKETIRPKYATPKGGEEVVVTAELPDSLLSRCKADESLLADILVKKFADHIPLYRQSEILSREGIFISRQLLSNWTVSCGLALKPLFNEMSRLVLSSQNVFIDEVPVDMLSPGKGTVQQSYMWVLVGGQEANPAYRVYNFRTNRCHINAAELLKGYHGVLHSDKYGAYESLANKKQFTWCPCWVHIRRKFIEAESGDPQFRALILRKMKYLFMFERTAWKRSEEERLRIRREKEIPLIEEMIKLVKERLTEGKILLKSKFKEALGYFCSLIPHLKNYTLHANARLDNNVAERAVRPLAIGRKNWLFLGNEEGGEAAAIILSLVQTCRAIHINPREYLEDVMRRIMSHSNQKLEELLPGKWVNSSLCQPV